MDPRVKNKVSDPVSGSGINNTDHISEALITIFWVKILKNLLCRSGIRDGKNSDSGSGMGKIRIRDPE